MKTIIFIGLNKSGSSREAVKAAEGLGYYTVVFTNREKQLQQRTEYPDVHQLVLVDLTNLEEIKEQIQLLQHRGNEIVAITSFIDSYVYTASMLANQFCGNHLSTDAIFIMENKEKTRSFFSTESYTPAFKLLEKETPLPLEMSANELTFPVMAKCAASTGSKDVIFAADMEELQKNVSRLRRKYPEETIIVEEYVDGEQYLVEVLVVDGKPHIAAFMEQEITRGKRFIITGYGILAEIPTEMKESITGIIHSIVSKLKLINGSFHLEVRLTGEGWKLIEINPRISGGAMNKMVAAAFGFSLVEETLKLQMGEAPSLEKQTNNYVFTQYVILDQNGTLERVTGKGRAKKIPGVVEVYVKPRKGTYLTTPMSMGHRYAYVIAKGDTLEEAKRIAKEAAEEIKFHIIEDDE